MAKSEKIQLYANKGFVSTEEAAEYLNCSEDWIRMMLKDGTLQYVIKSRSGNGGHNNIFFSSILDYLERLKSDDFISDNYFRKQPPEVTIDNKIPANRTWSKTDDLIARALKRVQTKN